MSDGGGAAGAVFGGIGHWENSRLVQHGNHIGDPRPNCHGFRAIPRDLTQPFHSLLRGFAGDPVAGRATIRRDAGRMACEALEEPRKFGAAGRAIHLTSGSFAVPPRRLAHARPLDRLRARKARLLHPPASRDRRHLRASRSRRSAAEPDAAGQRRRRPAARLCPFRARIRRLRALSPRPSARSRTTSTSWSRSPDLTDPEVLERMRELAFDLELNDMPVGTMSPFSLRKPGAGRRHGSRGARGHDRPRGGRARRSPTCSRTTR